MMPGSGQPPFCFSMIIPPESPGTVRRGRESLLEVKKVRDLTMKSGSLGGSYVSASSAIAVAGEYLYVAADDQMCLACFKSQGDEPGEWVRLFEGELPAEHKVRKARKPDLEAICVLPPNTLARHAALLVVPSGSKEWRTRACLLPLDATGKIAGEVLPLDFSQLYSFLRTKVCKLNIEGVAVAADRLLLANRGNSKDGDNAVIELNLNEFLYEAYDTHELSGRSFISVHHQKLGSIGGVALSFTDLCVIPSGQIIYCAAAESTDDDYLDGPCAGSAVAVGDEKFQTLQVHKLDTRLKVEGLYARPALNKPGRLELILVTDGDADSSIGAMLSTFVTL